MPIKQHLLQQFTLQRQLWETPRQNKRTISFPGAHSKPIGEAWLCLGPHSYRNALNKAPDELSQAATVLVQAWQAQPVSACLH